MPLIGLYRASKAALNAWSESLAIEVRPLGIRVHVVLPGRSPETKFGENARAYFGGQDDPVYGAMVDAFIQMARDNHSPVTHAGDVAKAIFAVANDQNAPLYTAAGEDARHYLHEAQQRSPFLIDFEARAVVLRDGCLLRRNKKRYIIEVGKLTLKQKGTLG
jgi:NAD(P)-dependent dehydrogenase (short-subunit alcohol dehydrogenase family)